MRRRVRNAFDRFELAGQWLGEGDAAPERPGVIVLDGRRVLAADGRRVIVASQAAE